jgi:hypothetical protein
MCVFICIYMPLSCYLIIKIHNYRRNSQMSSLMPPPHSPLAGFYTQTTHIFVQIKHRAGKRAKTVLPLIKPTLSYCSYSFFLNTELFILRLANRSRRRWREQSMGEGKGSRYSEAKDSPWELVNDVKS